MSGVTKLHMMGRGVLGGRLCSEWEGTRDGANLRNKAFNKIMDSPVSD